MKNSKSQLFSSVLEMAQIDIKLSLVGSVLSCDVSGYSQQSQSDACTPCVCSIGGNLNKIIPT